MDKQIQKPTEKDLQEQEQSSEQYNPINNTQYETAEASETLTIRNHKQGRELTLQSSKVDVGILGDVAIAILQNEEMKSFFDSTSNKSTTNNLTK